MLKTEKLKNDKEKIDQQKFMVSWSNNLNNDQIAKKLGVSPNTVLTVMADLNQKN